VTHSGDVNYWTEKVVLITGASSGIGRELSLEIAKRGAIVGLAARRLDLLEDLVREIESVRGKAVALPVDVKDAAAIRAAADRLRSEFGRIDVLIANAGMGTASHAVKLQPDLVANVINVNLLGAANSVAAVLPEMAERNQGHLVAISSLSAYRGLPKSAAYCASKAGLSAFFESVRIDLMNSGVKVTIIHPGFIRTALTAGREKKMPYLMGVETGVRKILTAIERQRKTYAFPWQLASVVRLGMIMPNFMYDWIAARNSYRE
jgi:short-subunit dehydrogenase